MADDNTYDHLFDGEPGEEELTSLSALLAEPALWEPADPETEDAIVALISAEMGASEPRTSSQTTSEVGTDHGADVIPISSARRWLGSITTGVAAAVILIALYSVGTTWFDTNDASPDGIEFALGATDLAPAGRATALITDTPQGTRILLDVAGLPPADDGSYYEAWLRKSPEIGVSAGTFHLRGGDGVIELWAGVTIEEYPLLTVTIQDEAIPESSGMVVLKVNTTSGG